MKANKFFAVAMAALAMVACKPSGDEPTGDKLELSKTSLSLMVGEEQTVEATVVADFTISDEKVAALTPANDGKSVKVKGLAKGSAFLTAKTKDGQSKTCAVAVVEEQQGGGAEVKGSKIWPILLDGQTFEANAAKVVADFRVDDTNRFLYVWENTYAAGDAKGKNFYGNNEGFTSLTVNAGPGWSGCGFFLDATNKEAYDALCKAIAADPENFYMHVAIKSTDNKAHLMYAFNKAENAAWAIGGNFEDNGKTYTSAGSFERDGEWHEFDFALAPFAAKIATVSMVPDDKGKVGANLVCFLSGGVGGTMLDIDAIYIYQK